MDYHITKTEKKERMKETDEATDLDTYEMAADEAWYLVQRMEKGKACASQKRLV
jgi:hypothetical protein